jgi:hypothetical protein
MKTTIIIEPELQKFVNDMCEFYANKINKSYYSKEDLIQECNILYYEIIMQQKAIKMKYKYVNKFKKAVQKYLIELFFKEKEF